MRCASSRRDRLATSSSCMSRLRSRKRTRSTSRRGLSPFCAKSLAPAANASPIAGRSLRPVSIRIGSSRLPAFLRSSRHASMPDMRGMFTSRITKSGRTVSNCSTASAPSLTVCTMKPAPASAASDSSNCAGSSSAIRIVVARFSSIDRVLKCRWRAGSRHEAPSRARRRSVSARGPPCGPPSGRIVHGPRSRSARVAPRACAHRDC